jgi:hypothetical protein
VVYGFLPKISFSALKTGSLLTGGGFGLLVGFIINVTVLMDLLDAGKVSDWRYNNLCGVAYGASVLLFGGIALIIAFIIELRTEKNGKG